MSLEQNIADAFANALGPIAENLAGSVSNKVVGGIEKIVDDLKRDLSGKEFVVTIKIPDLTK